MRHESRNLEQTTYHHAACILKPRANHFASCIMQPGVRLAVRVGPLLPTSRRVWELACWVWMVAESPPWSAGVRWICHVEWM